MQRAGAAGPELSGDRMTLSMTPGSILGGSDGPLTGQTTKGGYLESRSQDMTAKTQPGETPRQSPAYPLCETNGPPTTTPSF